MLISADGSLISVNSREGMSIPYTRWSVVDTTRTQVDISQSVIYFEITALKVRLQLVADASDPKGLRIILPRSYVEQLPDRPTPFVVVDETGTIPEVEWTGQIYRTGTIGTPMTTITATQVQSSNG